MVQIRGSLRDLTDADLKGVWEQYRARTSPTKWESITKGLGVPVTEEDRECVLVREELRRRGLYTCKPLSR